MFHDMSNRVIKKTYEVTKVVTALGDTPYTRPLNKPTIIFDCVNVTLSVTKDRIDVKSRASIKYVAKYCYDKTDFSGTIDLNNTRVVYDQPSSRTYSVMKVHDSKYGLTSYISNKLKISWDGVYISLKTSKPRVDVDTSPVIDIEAFYELDGLPLDGGVKLNDDLYKNEVGLYEYHPVSIVDNKYGLTMFRYNSLNIIYDMIKIELTSNNYRVNVGERVNISYKLYYSYDLKIFNGEVNLNSELYSDRVIKKTIYATRVVDPIYGLQKFSTNSIDVIWDKITINMRAVKSRLDISFKPEITWTAKYDYDLSSAQIYINFNEELNPKNDVGQKTYKTSSIIDPVYNITKFISNEVTIIWDRINIQVRFPTERVEATSSIKPTYAAYYEFDKTPFYGMILLNDTLVKNTLGRVTYCVSGINDPLYGLTKHESNIVSCIFDEINPEIEITTNMPNVVDVNLKLHYKTDNAPVNDATIYVNDEKLENKGDGNYHQTITTLFPSGKIDLLIKCPGFNPLPVYRNYIQFGNISLMGLFSIICASLILYRRTQQKYFLLRTKLKEFTSDKIIIPINYLSEILSFNKTDLINFLKKEINNNQIKGILSYDDDNYISIDAILNLPENRSRTYEDILNEFKNIGPITVIKPCSFLNKKTVIDIKSIPRASFQNNNPIKCIVHEPKTLKIDQYSGIINFSKDIKITLDKLVSLSFRIDESLIEIHTVKYSLIEPTDIHIYDVPIIKEVNIINNLKYPYIIHKINLLAFNSKEIFYFSVRLLEKSLEMGRKILSFTPKSIVNLYFDEWTDEDLARSFSDLFPRDQKTGYEPIPGHEEKGIRPIRRGAVKK